MDAMNLEPLVGLAVTWLQSPLGQAVALALTIGLFGALGLVDTDSVVLEKGLKATFYQAYDAATPFYPDITTEVPSTAKEEKYAWLGTAPTMREWVDERQPKGLLEHDYTISNKHYEASLDVDGDTLADDQLGQIRMRVTDMGQRARRYPDSLLSTLIENGETDLCYDGQAFFDTDHSEGDSGTQDNDLTASASDSAAPTQSEFEVAFSAAMRALMGFKDDRGEPYLEEWMLNQSNLVLMTPPTSMYDAALKTVQAGTISNTTNVYQNKARVVANARLSWTTKFALFYTGAPIKPFIFQNRQPVQTGMLGKGSEEGFMRNRYVFGADARYNVGYGLWQYAVLTTFS